MKAHWTETALGDVCQVVGGGTPKTAVAENWGGEIPWATPKDLSDQCTRHISTTARSITVAGLKRSGAQILPEGSVLLSSRAPIGLVAVNTVPMATNQGFKSLVPDQSRVDPEFLAHWLAANTNYLQSLGNGATFKEISKSVVAKVLIALPPLDEQRRIARVLDEVDRVRALRSRAQNGIKDLERAVFARAIRECAPGRKIPVGEAAEVLSGFPFSSAEFTDAGVRLCRGANVLPGKLDWSDLRCWASMDDPQLRRYVLGTDDIVVAMDRPWISSGFKIARVAPHDLPALLVQRVARLRADPMTLDQRLLFAALDSAEFQRHCRPTETTIPHISPKEIRSFALAVPSLAEQRRVAAALRRIDGIASREVEQLSRLDALFATLQRRAFSGEL